MLWSASMFEAVFCLIAVDLWISAINETIEKCMDSKLPTHFSTASAFKPCTYPQAPQPLLRLYTFVRKNNRFQQSALISHAIVTSHVSSHLSAFH